MAWYNTGTIALTNGSATVTGSGTNFLVGAQIGEALYAPDGKLYEIQTINSATVITLASNYLGSTASAQGYQIIPTQSLVADLASDVTDLISDFADVRDYAGNGKFNDGAVGTPGITFTQDQDNGLYRIGSNNWALAAGGIKQVDLSATDVEINYAGVKKLATTATGIDVTGTVTADGLTVDTDTLVVDATNNRVGIGTASPISLLTANNNGEAFITIRSSDTGNAGIQFGDQSDSVQGAIYQNATDNSLRFNGYNNAERMRIDSLGNLLVGKTAQNASTVGAEFGSSGWVAASRAGNTAAFFNRSTSDGEIVRLTKDGTTVGAIGTYSGDLWIGQGNTGLLFNDGGDVLRPANASGGNRDGNYDLGASDSRFKDLYLSSGVVFGDAGGSGTPASNTLDSYEEGTWTPTIVGSTTAGAFTYSVQAGTYTKVGDLVTVASAIYVTATATSPVGNMAIYGLPFTIGNQFPSFAIGWSQFITFADQLGAYGGGTQISLRNMLSGGSGSLIEGPDFGSSFYLFISGSYYV